MKVAVYTIAKDEEAFAERFAQSYTDADHIIVVDTGSTDGTIERLRECGVVVCSAHIDPWRFDTARNVALALIPEDVDVCFKTDLDEIASPDWRSALEEAWKPGIHNRGTTKFHPGPASWYWKNDLHSRHGWLWKFPIHECLFPADGTIENIVRLDDRFQTWHRPNIHKPRSSYLSSLQVAVEEYPEATQLAYWHARQYYLEGRHAEAIEKLRAYLDKYPHAWEGERATAMQQMAACMFVSGQKSEAVQWLYRSCAEAPYLREGWYELAKTLEQMGCWEEAYGAINAALRITQCTRNYLINPECWNEMPYKIAARLASQLGLVDVASKLSAEADRHLAAARRGEA